MFAAVYAIIVVTIIDAPGGFGEIYNIADAGGRVQFSK